MYTEGILPSVYCFFRQFLAYCFEVTFKHRHSVLFGKLECVVDIDEIADLS